MALTPEEKQIILFGKNNGKSLTETKAALARYRKAQASQQATTPKDDRILGKTQDVLTTVFGGDKIGEAIGATIAKRKVLSGDGVETFDFSKLTPEQKARLEERGVATTREETLAEAAGQIERPTGRQIAGDVVRTGLTFAPVGRAASLVSRGARALGMGARAASVTGGVVAGGAAGAGFDVAEDVAEGREVGLGAGTAIGAGIPAASPVFRALGRATAKITGKGTSEITGALTGTSAETVEQAFNAARRGGAELDQFTDALRGKTTPEKLVETTRTNIQKINTQRQNLFRTTLEELGDEIVETAPAKSSFVESLSDAGITVGDNGLLDFGSSKLKLVPAAQTKIQTAFTELNNLPATAPLLQIDTTRQALKALSQAGDDPSANLANKLIDDAVRGVRGVGEDVSGYGQMLDEFAETSNFLDELQRGLSASDKSTVDQAYRRMATALKTNNEQRMALVRELDQATEGAILSQISGQQLSEAMPRGIFRQISAGIAGGAAITGSVNPAILPGLLFASPRVVGEFARSLGIGARKAQILVDAISEARGLLIKAGIITGTAQDPAN